MSQLSRPLQEGLFREIKLVREPSQGKSEFLYLGGLGCMGFSGGVAAQDIDFVREQRVLPFESDEPIVCIRGVQRVSL